MRAENFPWDERTCAYAAKGGHLEVLKWARENDCPWDAKTCAWAARGGHLETLKWARDERLPVELRRRARGRRRAATSRCSSGRARTTARGRREGRARARRGAATSKFLSGRAKRLLVGRGGRASLRRRGGHLEVLKWLSVNGCPWDEWTCAFAAEGGHLEVLTVGARERLPVGREDVRPRGGLRPPRGAEVGARERLPVGRADVRVRGAERPPRDSEVGARERLPMGREDVRVRGDRTGTSRCCSGRARTAARGTSTRAKLRLNWDTWKPEPHTRGTGSAPRPSEP